MAGDAFASPCPCPLPPTLWRLFSAMRQRSRNQIRLLCSKPQSDDVEPTVSGITAERSKSTLASKRSRWRRSARSARSALDLCFTIIRQASQAAGSRKLVNSRTACDRLYDLKVQNKQSYGRRAGSERLRKEEQKLMQTRRKKTSVNDTEQKFRFPQSQ
jgi:hypothetical protein